jgi:glycosyltransferase involved in cell wall biosynthesis
MTRSSPAKRNSDEVVTVIIPVFNTTPQLIERAVCSVLDQTHPQIELLIVDDGSDLEIAEFLDDTAAVESRIRVVHRENGGVSAARNTGVECALGEFIAFLDADDYLAPDFLRSALCVARTTGADAVFGGISVLRESGSVVWRAGGPSANEPLLGTQDMIVSACVGALSDSPSPYQSTPVLSVTNVVSSILRTDNARRHNFREGVSHAEDRLYILSMLLEPARVAFCSDVWYVYDQTDEHSITRRVTPQMINALGRTVREFASVARGLEGGHNLAESDWDRITHAAADGVLNYLKVLTGAMAVVRGGRANRLLLLALLKEPVVRLAVARSARTSWKDRIFASAAHRGHVGLLCLLGRLWVGSGGLEFSAARTARPASGMKP